jgi:hypothetical protein
VTSTPPSHTINREELAGIDIGLQLDHAHLRLIYNALSLRLIQGYMRCSTAYHHHIHRETFESITHTLHTQCTSGLRTYLSKIKAAPHKSKSSAWCCSCRWWRGQGSW